MKKKNKTRYGLGIKGRLILCFSFMVVFILVIVSICQIFLLGFFYRRTRNNELNNAAIALMAVVGQGNESEAAFNLSVQNSMCIRLFEYSNDSFSEEICSVDYAPSCLIHHMPKDVLLSYCRKAVENGGTFSETVEMVGNKKLGYDDESAGNDAFRRNSPLSVNSQSIQVRIVSGHDGKEYAMFLNADIAPLNSTKKTLSTQYVWILISTLIIAAALADIFSRIVSKPLVKMTNSAVKMAAGDYDTKFAVEGYRETCELADALNYAASEISKADRMQKELIANVSHDLRTPLTMISGYAEVMRDIPGENTPENIQVIIDESKQLTNLVNDMLDLSKLSAGSRIPEKTYFNITELLMGVMSRYAAFTEHSGYDISAECDAEAFVFADKTMITQVITNLVNNAINYTGADKVIRVRQILGEDGRRVRLLFTDNGEGIAPENIPMIWERYYKVDREHRRASVGTGLGLSIVRNILQLHGASYGVESILGTGSTFWFELETAAPKAQ